MAPATRAAIHNVNSRNGLWFMGSLSLLPERQRARVARELTPDRDIGKIGMARGAAERHQRAEAAPVPQLALAALDRAQAHELAIDLPARHGEEQGGGAGIAAHDVDAEPQH